MKRVIALWLTIMMCLSLCACAEKKKVFFRNVAWEMSPKEVEQAEGRQGYLWDKHNLYTVEGLECYGYPCDVAYEFSEHKLNRALVMFDDISDTKFKRIYDAIIVDVGSEGEILEAFENPVLPLLKVQWITDNAVMTAVYCDGTDQIPKSASIEYLPL